METNFGYLITLNFVIRYVFIHTVRGNIIAQVVMLNLFIELTYK